MLFCLSPRTKQDMMHTALSRSVKARSHDRTRHRAPGSAVSLEPKTGDGSGPIGAMSGEDINSGASDYHQDAQREDRRIGVPDLGR